MRWPSRRGADQPRRAAEQPQVAVPLDPPVAAEPEQAPSAGWAALPAIAPSWSAHAPLTTSAAPVLPPTITHRTRLASSDGAPEPGRVVGLVAVVAPITTAPPPSDADLAEGDSNAARYAEPPPLRHAIARPIVEHAALTQATDEWVGQPAVSAPPPPVVVQATPPIEATTDAGARFREALANLSKSGAPEYRPGSSYDETPSSPVFAPPPRPDAAPRPAVARPTGELPHRRASLAESRRLGLGAPVRPSELDPEQTPLTHPSAARAADAATPADAPATVTPPPPPPPAEPAAALPVTPSPPVIAPPEAPSRARSAGRHSRRSADGSADGSDDGDDSPDDRADEPTPRERIQPVPTVRPIIDGSARPAASSNTLVFRAAAQPGPAPAAALPRPVERAVVTRPPTELAQALRTSHGIDVADVPVRRDSDAGSEARTRGARAFTRAATVHLPDDAGPVTSAAARGLLAHELVHAAQQRRLGESLPSEDTTEGRRLEAEAVAAERMYTRDAELTPDTPLLHAPQPVSAEWVDERIVQHAPVSPSAPLTLPPTLEPMRQDIERVADHSARRVVEEWTNPALTGATTPGAPVHVPGLNPPAPPGIGPAPVMPTLTATPPTTARPGAGAALTEAQREQNYLDILNAQHTRRGEPFQSSLTPEDREVMHTIFGPAGTATGAVSGTGAAGVAGAPQTPAAPTTMTWIAGRGFVASGPAAAEVANNMQAAWGGGSMGAFGARLAPEVDPPPTIPTPASTGTATSAAAPGTGTGTGPAAAPGTGPAAGATAATAAAAAASATRPNLAGAAGTTRVTAPLGTPGARPGTAAAAATPQVVDARTLSMAAALDNLFGVQRDDQDAEAAAQAEQAAKASAASAARTKAAIASAAQDASAAHAVASGPIDLDRINMEALSVRIYDRLRSKLRQEFLIDRERAGLLTDYR